APSPGLLFNLAQAYRLAGDCDDAAWMYRRYLESEPTPDRRTLAEGHLATVDRCRTGRLQVAVAPATLDAKVPEPDDAAPRPAVTVATSEPDPGRRQKEVGLWLAIGGGAAMLGAAYFAYDAHDASNTVEELYKKGGKWDEIRETDARGRRSATL